MVDPHNVESVGQRRAEHEQRADEAESGSLAVLIKQADAGHGQPQAEQGLPGQLFLVDKHHDERNQNGIDKQKRGSDAHSHVVVALKQRPRRQRHQQPQHEQRRDLPALQTEIPPASLQHDPQQGNGEQITEKQYRIRTHTRIIERKSEQGIHTIGSRSHSSQRIAF